jgi:putative SOS response-associated peptidase YedK
MCGRFTLTAELAEIKELIAGLRGDIHLESRYNIAPSQPVLTVLNDGSKEITFTRWGLIPSWAKDISTGNRLINARSETVHQKPSFKDSLRRRRCLILADGFYEWQETLGKKPKIPWYIQLKSHKPFAFAGLWSSWIDKSSGEELLTSTIITTSANALLEKIHDRMPVILNPEHYSEWLSTEERPSERLLPLLTPYPPDELRAFMVSTIVNNPLVDNEECIRSI